MSKFNFMKDDKCSDCGNCCGNILPLSKTEINIIKIYIQEHSIKAQKGRNPLSCPFRDEKNKCCIIYEVRPFICKIWRCDGKITQKQNKALLQRKMFPVNMKSLFFGNGEER